MIRCHRFRPTFQDFVGIDIFADCGVSTFTGKNRSDDEDNQTTADKSLFQEKYFKWDRNTP